jgi:hypothetical protein
MFVYPTTDLDRGRKLLSLLGSFWSSVYERRDVIQKYCEARGETAQQVYLNCMEALRALSRYEVPIFHEQNWHLHVIKRSDQRFDTFTSRFVWDIPPDFVRAPLIMNRLADPSVVLSYGVDFVIEPLQRKYLFEADPFLDSRWGTRPVFDGDAQVDTELFLWIFKGQFDWKYVYEHWGYVLNTALESSEAYRDFLNAIFDALAGGTALEQVQLAFATMMGLPLAVGGETVEALIEDSRGQVVVTEKGAYRVPADAELTVSRGEVLIPGQSFIDGLQFAELNNGVVPDWVNALVLGRGMLVGQFHSDLVFDNQDLPLTVTSDEDGYTRIEFPIGGFPLDVEEFWDRVHYQGRARGKTLAELMDTRTNTEGGQPEASNLPATVNPVKFLAENVLRNNAILVRVKMASMADDAIGLSPARLLRKIVPPGTALLVLIEVSPKTTSVILDSAPTATTPGGRYEIGSFDGAPTVGQMIGEESLPKRVSAWKVSGTCQ